MASPLVKSRWPTGDDFPDFLADLEKVSLNFPEPQNPEFTSYINPIGIEVEVEGWYNTGHNGHTCWELREDGSLKDHGRELVSGILSGIIIDYALQELDKILITAGKIHPLSWSHRTSIHVHANLSHLPIVKLKWLIAYYALTEPLWYRYCDERRIGNSFCFPLTSMNPRSIVPGKNWPKYCGLNLGTSLCQFNTVEFRQMHGHHDMDLYKTWIKLICRFINFIHETPVKTLRHDMTTYLNTGKVTFKHIFGSLPSNVNTLLYDTSKWVSDYLHQGAK